MKTKVIIPTFTALFLSLTLLSLNADAYDATGTWYFFATNGRSECSMTGPPGAVGTITITQYGNLINIKWSPYTGTEFNFSGGVADNRYQSFGTWSASSFPIYATLIFDLKSENYGKGYWLNTTDHNCYDSFDLELRKQDTCTPSDTVMCLQNGRFRISVKWWDEHGNAGLGTAVPSTDDSGLFWFFSPSNMELLIKVLNGCGINNKYWVFFAATTDQKFTVTVTDTKTGEFEEYTNPLKNPADAVTDTDAFATCP